MTKKLTRAEKYRKGANFPTDKDFIKYVLSCAENILGREGISEKRPEDEYGLIPPILQLYKLRRETVVYLEETQEEKEVIKNANRI